MSAVEVLAADELSLPELAAEANREHALVLEAGASMVEHAIRAGGALLLARERCEHGEWGLWVEENLATSYGHACVYMRLARHQDAVRQGGAQTIVDAKRLLTGAESAAHGNKGPLSWPSWMIEEARALHSQGVSPTDVAATLGIARKTVRLWTDSEYREKVRERRRAAHARRREVERLAKEQRSRQAIKRAVKKAGAAEQELYAMCERMQDVLGQAHREATDPAKRRHYALMGEHYRKMRDEGVLALGVR